MIRLKELRKEKKLSQKDVANFLEVAQNTVSNWEQGLRRIDLNSLTKLSDFYDVSVDYILGKTYVQREVQPNELLIALNDQTKNLSDEALTKILEFTKFIREQEKKE